MPGATRNDSHSKPIPYREAPWSLFVYDIRLALRVTFSQLLTLVWPIHSSNPNREISLAPRNVFPGIVHFLLFIITVLSVLLIPAWFILPGLAWLPWALAVVASTWSLSLLLNTLSSEPVPHPAQPGAEHWVFVNGICTGKSWAEAATTELSNHFGRPVACIHNRTFGLILDLLQCATQRSLGLYTNCIRETYSELHKAVLDTRNKKIVIIGHSQGALIVSLAVDMLLSDLPREKLEGRIEVYTFGGAANHFNNPGGVLKVVEHYVNEFDPVANIGVSMYAPMGGNQFAGKVFQRRSGYGHLLVMHYLENLEVEGENGYRCFEEVQAVGTDTKTKELKSQLKTYINGAGKL